MLAPLRATVVMLGALTFLTGVAYPLFIMGIAQAGFPRQANGSLISDQGRVVGSALIGQPFDAPKYFWSRPSGTTPGYNGQASAGTNLGPTNPLLTAAVKSRIDTLRKSDPDMHADVPVDLVTASGSGLDPDISPASALYQVHRVAEVRGIEEAKLRGLVAAHTDGPDLGVLGEPRVNVLKLNLALDAMR